MSHAIDESYAVYNEQVRRARKAHACGACNETIEPGHRYAVVSWVFAGTAQAIKRCLRCQTLHEHLRDLGSDMWPDEDLNCGEEYESEWGPLPDHIAELAFSTPADMQKIYKDAPR